MGEVGLGKVRVGALHIVHGLKGLGASAFVHLTLHLGVVPSCLLLVVDYCLQVLLLVRTAGDQVLDVTPGVVLLPRDVVLGALALPHLHFNRVLRSLVLVLEL